MLPKGNTTSDSRKKTAGLSQLPTDGPRTAMRHGWKRRIYRSNLNPSAHHTVLSRDKADGCGLALELCQTRCNNRRSLCELIVRIESDPVAFPRETSHEYR
jgi:hypothetical protein